MEMTSRSINKIQQNPSSSLSKIIWFQGYELTLCTASFEVLTAVLLRIHVVWNVTPCLAWVGPDDVKDIVPSFLKDKRAEKKVLDYSDLYDFVPADRSKKSLRSVGTHSPYTRRHNRKPKHLFYGICATTAYTDIK